RSIPGMIFAYRAAIAQSRGDMAGAAAHARRAYELAAPEDHLSRGAAAGLSGLASWTIGDLGAARASWIDSLASLDLADHVADAMGGSIALADILIAQGRLSEAAAVFEQRLTLIARSNLKDVRGVGDMHVGLAKVLCERGDLAGAKEHLDADRALGDAGSMPQNPYRARVAAAHVAWAEGDLAAALQLLDDAEAVYIGDFFPAVRPIPAIRARVLVAQGREADALAWARGRGLSINDDLSYLAEYEHVTLALALIAQGRRTRDDTSLADAERLLGRLRAASEAGERNGSLIEILVAETLAHQARGQRPDAVASLRTAVTLAQPEGYQLTFTVHGDHIVGPLKALAKEGTAPAYVRTLVAAIVSGGTAATGDQSLIEPLSDRELDVLRLLRTELSGPEIARELFVSLNTVRTHTKSIFMKLGVNNRRAAVRAADELGLFARP
ncbi:MAG: LuxR C-terminal-related transcriptional regulator, partial [Actinomycetota bacterium]